MASLTTEFDTPVSLRPVSERSLTRRLLEWVEASPERVAVTCAATDRELTYAGLLESGLGLASVLRSMGASAGDHVGIMLPNSLEWVITWAGALVGGFVDVGIDAEARAAMLEHYVRAADVRFLVCHESQIVAVRNADLPDVRLLVWGASGRTEDQSVPAELRWDGVPIVHRDPRDDMSIRFTSGTTGPAKPAMLTQSHLEVWAAHFGQLMEAGPEDRLYTPFPLSHHLASVMGLLAMVYVGGTCIIDARFSRTRFWTAVRTNSATLIHVLQPVINILLSSPESDDDRAHTVRRGYIGVPDSGFEERFGIEILVAYGLTEGSMLAYMLPGDAGPSRPESIALGGQVLGQVNPHFEVKILDEWDQECGPGEKGIICFRPRTPYLALQRYHNYEAATAAASTNQWFHTGDLGCFDGEHYLHFFGRQGDTVRRKGHNIPLFHVEEAARQFPSVRESCVLPIPLPGNEYDLKLIVVPRGDSDVDLPALFNHLAAQLTAVMIPSYVEVRRDVPRTRTLKILKTALEAEGVNGLTASTLRTSDWRPAIDHVPDLPSAP